MNDSGMTERGAILVEALARQARSGVHERELSRHVLAGSLNHVQLRRHSRHAPTAYHGNATAAGTASDAANACFVSLRHE